MSTDAVGEVGTPARVGELAKTNDPVPVSSVTAVARFADDGVPSHVATPEPNEVIPVPPFATGSVPDTCVVSPIFPHDGAVPIPPDISAFPVATPASLASVVEPEAKIISPTAYEVKPVPPLFTAIVVAFQVPMVIVPTAVRLEETIPDPNALALKTVTSLISYTFVLAILKLPRTFTCPEVFPMLIVVASPPMFKVVTAVLNTAAVAEDVVMDPPFIVRLFTKAGLVKNVSKTSERSCISPATFTGSVEMGYGKL